VRRKLEIAVSYSLSFSLVVSLHPAQSTRITLYVNTYAQRERKTRAGKKAPAHARKRCASFTLPLTKTQIFVPSYTKIFPNLRYGNRRKLQTEGLPRYHRYRRRWGSTAQEEEHPPMKIIFRVDAFVPLRNVTGITIQLRAS